MKRKFWKEVCALYSGSAAADWQSLQWTEEQSELQLSDLTEDQVTFIEKERTKRQRDEKDTHVRLPHERIPCLQPCPLDHCISARLSRALCHAAQPASGEAATQSIMSSCSIPPDL